MKKLFLCSSFKDVASILSNFAEEDFNGKTVAFIPTASIPEKMKFYVKAAKKAFEKMGLIVNELEITQASEKELKHQLKQNDYIYVSGGNTFFLLQELKRTGADKLIVEQIELGKLYIGESAGSMVVSPNIEYVKDMDNCKKAPDLDTFGALNIIDFYPVPHHTNFPFAKTVEKIIATFSADLNLYPMNNSQAILVNGQDIKIKNNNTF